MRKSTFTCVLVALWVSACSESDPSQLPTQPGATPTTHEGARTGYEGLGPTDARLVNADAEQDNWLTHGRTYNEQRFSPLAQINKDSLADLQLAWFWDTGTTRGLEATPLVVDGVMYSTGTWSVVYAHNAATGTLLWKHDPAIDRKYGYNACCDVVNRGVAVWQDAVFVGTLDGRLQALNAATGELMWERRTTDRDKPYTITGAPRIVNGMVLIGNGGAELGVRGYVTAYDAKSGDQVWRFYTVPGNPDQPFEHADLAEAAKTWRGGAWWEIGGGGTVWDAIAFDPDLNLVYLGVGNGSPWSRYSRSPGGGDNLYLASIVALNAESGEYVWHYQTTPGDNWDYTAVQQMVLADLEIAGEVRQVIMQAPKNGFFYVLDRATGQFISAENYVPVTWASHVDAETGRPVEVPEGQYLDQPKIVHPGPAGGHNWHPMSFSPRTGLVYIPIVENRLGYAQERDYAYDKETWNTGIDFEFNSKLDDGFATTTKLVAWNPRTQSPAWTYVHGHGAASGVLATAADLVFQSGADCTFAAFDAVNGERLWTSETHMGSIAAPISYAVDGEQYIAFVAGWGGATGLYGSVPCADERRAATGRILAYKLGGTAKLPDGQPTPRRIDPPATLDVDSATLALGGKLYRRHCGFCHSLGADDAGVIPNLATIPQASHDAWDAIVLGGARRDKGMVSFAHLLDQAQAQAIRAHVINEAHIAKSKRAALVEARIAKRQTAGTIVH